LSSSAPSDVSMPADHAPADQVHLSVDEARALALSACRRIGLSEEDATLVTDHLIDAGLCGYQFASLPRILAVAGEMRERPAPTPMTITYETPVSAMIDGGNHCGYVTSYKAAELGITKAQEHGFAITGAYNTFLSGRNAYYLEMVANAGLVGIHVAGAPAKVAPLGGAAPALGTNPIAFGLPSSDGPLVFDMGTSALMWGEVQLFARLGMPLPEGVAVDADGHPTSDASRALDGAVLPFGGHKGFGLSLVVQALSLLTGAYNARGLLQDYGFLHLIIDPVLMMPREEYYHQVAELVAQVKQTPRQAGVTEIRIPGERARQERQRRLTEGLDVDRRVVAALEAL
jgi:LDH2 family malate/lactate/ureidoglycolate dehydrogenase